MSLKVNAKDFSSILLFLNHTPGTLKRTTESRLKLSVLIQLCPKTSPLSAAQGQLSRPGGQGAQHGTMAGK
jgi:hypothetical protein